MRASALALALVLVAGASARASTAPSVAHPAWSSNGKTVAWTTSSSSSGRIYVASSSGKGAHAVSKPFAALGELTWLQSDGLVFIANARLFRMSLVSQAAHLLGYGIYFATDRAADVIAWQSADTCPLCHGPIVVANLAAGRKVRLGGQKVQNASPTLSPNGREVAFSRTFWNSAAGEYSTEGGIWTSPTNSSSLRKISATGTCLTWSPDGGHIAYVDGSALRVITPHGSGLLRLAANAACNLSSPPAWSPNSHALAFTSQNGRLSVVQVARRRTTSVTTGAMGTVTGFAWSPDSTELLVTSVKQTSSGPVCSELWLVRSDGSRLTRVRSCS